jgi:membrane-associated phospholipid phosphatase
LLIAQAWGEIPYVNKAMPLVGALVIVSTVPMGGHYFVDLIAGFVLWWGCSTTLNTFLQSRARIPSRVIGPAFFGPDARQALG